MMIWCHERHSDRLSHALTPIWRRLLHPDKRHHQVIHSDFSLIDPGYTSPMQLRTVRLRRSLSPLSGRTILTCLLSHKYQLIQCFKSHPFFIHFFPPIRMGGIRCYSYPFSSDKGIISRVGSVFVVTSCNAGVGSRSSKFSSPKLSGTHSTLLFALSSNPSPQLGP